MSWTANGLFVVVLGMGVGAVAWWVAQHPAWTITGITVLGDVRHQNEVKLRSHLGSRLEGTFLTVDLQHVQQLIEGVPWVRSALVQREFPNRLRVVIEEHDVVAWWGEAGSGRLLNRYGEVFEAQAEGTQAEPVVELIGPDDLSMQVHALYQALGPVFERIDRDVQRLELDARGSWKARLDGGTEIQLGRGDASTLVERARTFATTVPTLMAHYGQRDIETVDLRYPNGYALRMRGVTTLIAPAPIPVQVSPPAQDPAPAPGSPPQPANTPAQR